MANKNAIWIIGAVVVAYLMFFNKPATAPIGNTSGGGGTTIVTTGTTLQFVTADALSPGTSVTTTNWVSINGGELKNGLTAANPGDIISVHLVNDTTYHNAYIPSATVTKVTETIQAKLKGNASITLTVFNTDNSKMTNNGGATNQTVAAGGSYNMVIRMDGQDKKSTQDMRCVLEASDNTKADKMTLTGFGATYVGMSKPSSYTLAATTSQVWIYDIAPIEGAVSPTGTIGITSKTSQSLATTYFILSCFTKEYFKDSITGKVVYDIEDSAGTGKYLAKYTFKGYFS